MVCTRKARMSSVKSCVVGVAAGLAALGSVGAVAQSSVTLRVDKEMQAVQTPLTAGQAGIAYRQTGANASALDIYTKGFLFCANVSSGNVVQSASTLTIHHEDQEFTPPHPWSFPSVTDVTTFSYTGALLSVVSGESVTCLSTSDKGATASGLTEGVFENGYDSQTEENFPHLVNWIPPAGFDWFHPDWSEVPVDPCTSTRNQPARVEEDVACAAVTGARPDQEGTVRSPVMWTAFDGVSFTYLFRLDARFGAAQPGQATQMQIPQSVNGTDGTSPDALQAQIFDAYDSAFLSDQGQYCVLADLPATLSSSTCAQSNAINGHLKYSFSIAAPPADPTGYRSYYMVVTRTLGQSNHQSNDTPAVAVSVLLEGALVTEGGDKFSGDNIVFGFMPTSSGFPWMHGQ